MVAHYVKTDCYVSFTSNWASIERVVLVYMLKNRWKMVFEVVTFQETNMAAGHVSDDPRTSQQLNHESVY